jgi:hypothetical protein
MFMSREPFFPQFEFIFLLFHVCFFIDPLVIKVSVLVVLNKSEAEILCLAATRVRVSLSQARCSGTSL